MNSAIRNPQSEVETRLDRSKRRFDRLSWSSSSSVFPPRARTRTRSSQRQAERGYELVELMVYISVLFLVLGAGYLAVDRCVDSSIVLRRSADDLASALHAGERWRADIRAATRTVRLENAAAGQVVHLESDRGEIVYRFSDGAVSRRVGAASWTTVLANVASSSIAADPRQNVRAWRWELELKPRSKASASASRVRPLFTFIAAQPRPSTQ